MRTDKDYIIIGMELSNTRNTLLSDLKDNDFSFFKNYIDDLSDLLIINIFTALAAPHLKKYGMYLGHAKYLECDEWIEKLKSLAADMTYKDMKSFPSKIVKSCNNDSDISKYRDIYNNILLTLLSLGEISKERYIEFCKDVVLNTLYSKQKFNYYDILNIAFEHDSNFANDIVNDVSFKSYSSHIRADMYRSFVNQGLLTKKISRRIRSDSSESASLAGVTSLIHNYNNYDDAKGLITQMTDIRHRGCQIFLARNAPDKIIPFMMGFSDSSAKKIIEKRLAQN